MALELGPNAQLAARTLAMEPCGGIPARFMHAMDQRFLEYAAGAAEGSFPQDPEGIYLGAQRALGVCMIDQFLAQNALTMGSRGYEGSTARKATTGAPTIERDGIVIDDADKVAEHMERFIFPQLEAQAAAVNPEDDGAAAKIVADLTARQKLFGPDILAVPHGRQFGNFPVMRYNLYGYVHYFTAYVMYPELMERDFKLQADLAEKTNAIAVRAFQKADIPQLIRLDFDMADNGGPLVDLRSLEAIWYPHFARAVKPLIDAKIRCLWHCDGNLMTMIPGLIEAGVSGFQGFQYEAGMDYVKICRMTDREGGPLQIWAGVSVTRTLPSGTPDDVRKEMQWLVQNGPPVGLVLGASSSITPGVPWPNLKAMAEGLHYYRTHGRKG